MECPSVRLTNRYRCITLSRRFHTGWTWGRRIATATMTDESAVSQRSFLADNMGGHGLRRHSRACPENPRTHSWRCFAVIFARPEIFGPRPRLMSRGKLGRALTLMPVRLRPVQPQQDF